MATKVCLLPPCARLPQNARHALAVNVPGFGSNARRSDPVRASGTALNNPGPGRYNTTKNVDAAFKPMTVASKDNVFGSQVRV